MADLDLSETRHDRRGKDNSEDEDPYDESSKHSSRKRSGSGRGDEKDRERDREHRSSRSNKEHDRDKEKERKDRGKEKEKEKTRERHKEREREKETRKERERERESDKDREKKGREKEREAGVDKEGLRERNRGSRKVVDDDSGRGKDDKALKDYEEEKDVGSLKQGEVSFNEEKYEVVSGGSNKSTSEIEKRILKMREERLKPQSEVGSEVLSWVNKSRKLEKEKVMHLSKIFEEQDNIGQGESDDEDSSNQPTHNLDGVKVLHGFEKVMEGGAVVLTLKDQSILADGDINEEMDMLENVEIGEQKRRNEAYKAAKKKTGIYDDKFNDDPNAEKKILPQYDDPTTEEGVVLDARGRFSGEAEKKLEELRRRLQGASTTNRIEDLTAAAKTSSDYFTHEEMLQFKKPKKKKSLRKKEKLDLDALEAEAKSAGLGVGDLVSRNNGTSRAIREEKERSEAEMRNTAYQSAYAKADEASKLLRLEQTLASKLEENETLVFADDEEELNKSLERTRKFALKKQEEAAGPQALARLAATTVNRFADDQDPAAGEPLENRVVFTEVEDFVRGLQLDEESHKPDAEDVFMEEDEAPRASVQQMNDKPSGLDDLQEPEKDENPVDEDKEIVPDETLHEVAVGKGLSGALKLLKERGTLKETVDWGGRNMDKKKSKLVGIVDNNNNIADHDRFKDIRIERTDEFGRIMTPKEAFRWISHKFHGKGPGKMKQEKRMKQYLEELKLKQMKNSDTPSLSVERMREAQAQLKTPYLVLSGHLKTGENSDPQSTLGNVQKDLPGGLTPMLGDKKVEHFLGIKRKAEPGNSGTPKRPKT